MPRTADIKTAFIAAIQLNPKGYQYLRTESFIEKLRDYNWHFTRSDANAWIERYLWGGDRFCMVVMWGKKGAEAMNDGGCEAR